jgi:hypothetical protein
MMSSMETRPPLSALTSEQLLARAREYRRMAASATTAGIRDALNLLAVRFAILAAQRTDARDDSVCEICAMCGRYASTIPIEQMARLFRTTNPLPNTQPSWNVCPTQDAVVIRRHPETGERHLNLLKWGLPPVL